METPSSARRIPRFQSQANSATKKMEGSENGVSKTTQRTVKQDRSALLDITNDSPIVGLASGNFETAISPLSGHRNNGCCKMTPGSGEALLRSQVKNLLQMVEEESMISKFSLKIEEFPICRNLKALMNSPAGLIAPTPANTPQVLNFSDMDELESLGFVSRSPIEDGLNVSKLVSGIVDEKNKTESDKDMISRTLFLDSSEKSDSSSDCSSVVTYQGIGSQIPGKPATMDDDDASIWSIQVNTSTRDEDDAILIEDDANSDVYKEELCKGMSNIHVNGHKFDGKHIKFVYNSDDELVGAKEECVPTLIGKQLRFDDEEL